MRSVAPPAEKQPAFQATTVSTAAIQTANAQVAATRARLATVVAQKKAARMGSRGSTRTWMLRANDCTAAGDGADQGKQQPRGKGPAGCVTGSVGALRVGVTALHSQEHDHTSASLDGDELNEFLQWIDRRSVIVSLRRCQPARQAIEPLSILRQLVHFIRGVRYRRQRVACWQRTSLVPPAASRIALSA
jgi:hypothetical protein